MLKKLIRMSVVMSLLLASTNAFAQGTGKADYPRYSLGSNWSIGASLGASWEMARHPADFAFGKSWDLGFAVFGQHKLNHVLSTRYRLAFPTMVFDQKLDDDNMYMVSYATLTANMLVSLPDLFYGFDPERRHSWYILGGFGILWNNTNTDKHAENQYESNRFLPDINFGLGYSLLFSEKWGFFAEGLLTFTDIPKPFGKGNWDGVLPDWHSTHGELHVGLTYNFGLNATDQAVAAQKNMLSQENFGALNTQVNNLERQVTQAKNNEKRLENRIAELEDELAKALAQGGKGNSAAADSLQAVINQIKADQLTFYAMPFSVQYEVNEWNVSEDEMLKVKAVARVLKDNPNVKVMVVGFADYTGSDSYNMKLSEKRANEVKRLLVKKYGIAEDRIQTDYKGKSVAFGDIQYALNRRVSFYRVIE